MSARARVARGGWARGFREASPWDGFAAGLPAQTGCQPARRWETAVRQWQSRQQAHESGGAGSYGGVNLQDCRRLWKKRSPFLFMVDGRVWRNLNVLWPVTVR